MNAAYLTKQGWKIFIQPDNIWVRIVKAKYLNNNTIISLKVRKKPTTSSTWRVYWIREILSREVLNGS